MTDETQTPLPLIDNEPVSPKTNKKGHGGFLFFLWLVLLIIVLGVAGYGWQQLQWVKQQIAASQTIITQIPELKDSVDLQIDNNNQAIKQQQQLTAALQNNITHLNTILTNNTDNWLITEAKHLLQLADLSLTYESNIPVTVVLLQLTDQRLAEIASPDLMAARTQLAHDIAALRAIAPVDVTGIYLRLSALRDQTLSTPLINKQFKQNFNQNILTMEPVNPSMSVWEKGLTGVTNALSQVLIIRHRLAPLEPLLAPDQEQILKQNLYWLYEQTQWALMHHNQAIYTASLSQISLLINQYFEMNTQATSILQSLAELQKINIDPTLPNINTTSELIQNFANKVLTKTLNQPQGVATPILSPNNPTAITAPSNPKPTTTTPNTTTSKSNVI